jgi:hypothetical protein
MGVEVSFVCAAPDSPVEESPVGRGEARAAYTDANTSPAFSSHAEDPEAAAPGSTALVGPARSGQAARSCAPAAGKFSRSTNRHRAVGRSLAARRRAPHAVRCRPPGMPTSGVWRVTRPLSVDENDMPCTLHLVECGSVYFDAYVIGDAYDGRSIVVVDRVSYAIFEFVDESAEVLRFIEQEDFAVSDLSNTELAISACKAAMRCDGRA